MNEIVNVDYMTVQERTLSVIVSEILTIERNVYSVALDGAIQIGQRLHEAKAQVEHGDWENWCKQNLNYSHSQATRFMKIATEYGDENSPYSKIATSQDFSISKALELLKVPEDEVENFVENNGIENDSVRELREKIEALNKEKEALEAGKKEADDEAATLRHANAVAADKEKSYEEEIESLKARLQEAKENGGDPEKLKAMEDKLSAAEAEIEAQKEKAKKLKEKAKAEKEKKDEEINAAVEAAKSEARQQTLAESGVPELEAKIASLEKKLANSADDNKVRFKVLVDDVQDTWNSCIYLAQADTSGNMLRALEIVIENMKEELKRG